MATADKNEAHEAPKRSRFERARVYVGYSIIFGAIGYSLYLEYFPTPTDEVIRTARESWESVQKKAAELQERADKPAEVMNENVPPDAQRGSQPIYEGLLVGLRVLAFCVGGFLIYLGSFLYEDESGKLQNRLENWWVRGHDAESNYLSKHLRFTRTLGSTSVKYLNLIFGERSVSVRSIVVSLCFALCSANLYQYLAGYESAFDNRILNASIWLLLGIAPLFLKDNWDRFLWCLTVAFIIWNDFLEGVLWVIGISLQIDQPFLAASVAVFLAAILVACVLAFLSILLIRVVLKKIANSGGVFSASFWLALTCIPVLILYQPFYLLWLMPESASPNVTFFSIVLLLTLVVVDSFLLIPSVLFLILTISLLIHKLFWGLINRSIYAFQRHEVAKRNLLLFSIGSVLLLFSFRAESTALSILEKLLKG